MYQLVMTTRHFKVVCTALTNYCFDSEPGNVCSIIHIASIEQCESKDGAVVNGARLPPMWPGFNSRTRHHMWVEFVVGSCPCSEGFSPGSLVISSLLKNQHFQIPIRSGIRGLQVYQVLCTCHQLAPGVGPRANQGDCKMG